MLSNITDRVGSGIAVPVFGVAVSLTGEPVTSTRQDKCIVQVGLTLASTLEYMIVSSDRGPKPSTCCGEGVVGPGEPSTNTAGFARDCRPIRTGSR
jgi:hypothetical protein